MPATGNKSYHPLSLSIRLHADGFSFFVCDPQTSSLVRGEHFRRSADVPLAQQLQQELCRPDYFNRQIDQTYVLICTPSTRGPLEEFRRDEAAALYGLTFAGEDPLTVLKKYVDRVGHVHLKDMRADVVARVKPEGWSFLQAVRNGAFTVPGDGCVDYDPIFRLLADAKYEGWLLVEAEQDPAKANPLEYAIKARKYIREHTGL